MISKNIISVIIFYIGHIAQMKYKKNTRKVKLRGFPVSSDIGRKNIEGAKRVKIEIQERRKPASDEFFTAFVTVAHKLLMES